MALYKRWVDLKNGVCTRDFMMVGEEQEEPSDETPDFNLAQIQSDLRDTSKPIELTSAGMIRFVIEDSVKKQFAA